MSAALPARPKMTERPIPFTAESVRAILEGRKTQTRRIIKPQPQLYDFGSGGVRPALTGRQLASGYIAIGADVASNNMASVRCPHGARGDRLWVREEFRGGERAARGPFIEYVADGREATAIDLVEFVRWERRLVEKGRRAFGSHPGMFMPRWAARLVLEVATVRVQPLQEITEEDAQAEAAPVLAIAPEQGLTSADGRTHGTHPHTLAFAIGWYTLHTEPANWWIRNPWVWAITFKVVARG